jgi:tRNA 2-thiouridine synthesizing protein E
MRTQIIAGTEVLLGNDGYFIQPKQWREEMASYMAKEEGIDELSPQQWEIIRFMRHEYEHNGAGPSVRALSRSSGVSIRTLYELFPRGPAKEAARLAGIPKPVGCI